MGNEVKLKTAAEADRETQDSISVSGIEDNCTGFEARRTYPAHPVRE